MKTKLYIAYGSNLNLPQMAQRCPTAKVVGTSEIKDYTLLFRGHGGDAVATIEPKEGSRVPVLLWEITQHDENALDRYEGYPCFYNKHVMDVEVDGQSVTAMAYVMTDGHRAGYPSFAYYKTIADGYETAGFDAGFLERAVNNTEQLMVSELEPEQGESFGTMKWW